MTPLVEHAGQGAPVFQSQHRGVNAVLFRQDAALVGQYVRGGKAQRAADALSGRHDARDLHGNTSVTGLIIQKISLRGNYVAVSGVKLRKADALR